MSEHSRFLNIERARADSEAPEETADRARIAAVVEAGPASRVSGGAAGDGAPASESESEIDAGAMELQPALAAFSTGAVIRPEGGGQEIADMPALPIDVGTVEGQPFVRCGRCGRDNTIHAERCEDCALELDTAAQRAFNEKLWNAQRASREKQREALATMAARRQEERRSTLRPLPPPGILPPPELTRPIDPNDGPYLLEVARKLSRNRWRLAFSAAIMVLPFFLVGLGSTALSWIGRGLLLLLVLGMLPRRLWLRVRAWCSGMVRRD